MLHFDSPPNRPPFSSSYMLLIYFRFTFTEKDLGDLEKVIIGHDNSGAGAAWMLTQVLVKSIRTNDLYLFPCGQWFDKSSGDLKIVRELPVAKN